MPATVLYMSMSVDGFIAGPNDRVDNGLGDGGERLHEWVFDGGTGDTTSIAAVGGVGNQVIDEFMATRLGRRRPGHLRARRVVGAATTYDGVPIFVLTARSHDRMQHWPPRHLRRRRHRRQ